MQNQKAGFGMALKESYSHGTARLPLEGFSCNLIFEDFSKLCQGKFMFP